MSKYLSDKKTNQFKWTHVYNSNKQEDYSYLTFLQEDYSQINEIDFEFDVLN